MTPGYENGPPRETQKDSPLVAIVALMLAALFVGGYFLPTNELPASMVPQAKATN